MQSSPCCWLGGVCCWIGGVWSKAKGLQDTHDRVSRWPEQEQIEQACGGAGSEACKQWLWCGVVYHLVEPGSEHLAVPFQGATALHLGGIRDSCIEFFSRIDKVWESRDDRTALQQQAGSATSTFFTMASISGICTSSRSDLVTKFTVSWCSSSMLLIVLLQTRVQ